MSNILLKLQAVTKKAKINVEFESKMGGREYVMKEVYVFLKASSTYVSRVCDLSTCLDIEDSLLIH